MHSFVHSHFVQNFYSLWYSYDLVKYVLLSKHRFLFTKEVPKAFAFLQKTPDVVQHGALLGTVRKSNLLTIYKIFLIKVLTLKKDFYA